MFPHSFSTSQRYSAKSQISVFDTLFLNCIFSGNGGGLFVNNVGSDLIIKKCSFICCSSTGNGGGIYCLSNSSEINDCCFSNCVSSLYSSSVCDSNCNYMRNSLSFGKSSSGSLLFTGKSTACEYTNSSYQVSSYQMATFYVNAKSFRCSHSTLIHSKDANGCSFTIHYTQESIVDRINLYNISTGNTYSLLFFGHNSRVNMTDCYLFKGTHPKGFQEYSNSGSQYYQFIRCSVNFPLSDFGSWNKNGSNLDLSATLVSPVGNSIFDCNEYQNGQTYRITRPNRMLSILIPLIN